MKTQSKSTSKSPLGLSLIISGLVAATLSLTPWVNSDSLIIPKGMILFCLAAYSLPKLFNLMFNYKLTKGLKLLNILAFLFILQMVLVMIISSAPIEQQFFGRTGRGLGFATYTSLIVLILISAYLAIDTKDIQKIIIGIVISCILSSLYSVFQRFGYDIFDWVTATNGIIGTLGNPNFQSSFVAMALIPSLVIFQFSRKLYFLTPILFLFFIFTLYICESTQGYIASIIALSSFILLYLWYRKKVLFYFYACITFILGTIAIFGMLNKGPLSIYLYKNSVQSRGEMWRTGLNTVSDNPLFGIGLDSFGDYSFKYRDLATVNGINEYTDNVHNFFLQFAITGGLLLSMIYLIIILFGLHSFYLVQRKKGTFDSKLAAVFAAWISFQLQSVISPANISMLAWNFVITGLIIGYAHSAQFKTKIISQKNTSSFNITRPVGTLLLILSLALMYPWYNSDKISWAAKQAQNATALVQAVQIYPESSVRYIRVAVDLYNANLLKESLIVAKSAVEFNPNSPQGWMLILINQTASIEERRSAREQVLKLDPLNKEVAALRL